MSKTSFLPATQGHGQRAAATTSRNTGYPHLSDEVLRADATIQRFFTMLAYMRPGGSPTEEAYISRFIDNLPGVKEDGYGNRWVVVGKRPNIMFSSHTDTVHTEHGFQEVRMHDGVAWAECSSCLGADDTTGNWLMIEMINAGVEGMYVFHRDEETGGGGSRYMADVYGDDLQKAGIQACIALDRKGYGDVITHQGWSRTCSDAFAKSLAAILGGRFKPDDGGVFTDSANYTECIGECTNLSVGYFAQHGPAEVTNVAFLSQLREVLIHADWSTLVFERQPGDEDPDSRWSEWSASYKGYGYGGTRSSWSQPAKRRSKEDELYTYVYENPDAVAQWLEMYGATIEEIERDLYGRAYGDDRDDRWDDEEVVEIDVEVEIHRKRGH
jgi:hypothetical protein